MRKLPELDAIRGLAALGIVLYHAYPYTCYLGWGCVDLFFVLSGFLISTIIFENVKRRRFFATFYFRRALRIWPVYYLTLFAVIAINKASRTGYSTAGFEWHVVFLQNTQTYVHAPVPPFPYAFGASWSVAIEEQFYFVWPVLIWLVGPRSTAPLTLLLMATSVVARGCGLPSTVLVARFDGLALGSLLAVLWRWVSDCDERTHAARLCRIVRLLVAVGIPSVAAVCLIAFRSWRKGPHPGRA